MIFLICDLPIIKNVTVDSLGWHKYFKWKVTIRWCLTEIFTGQYQAASRIVACLTNAVPTFNLEEGERLGKTREFKSGKFTKDEKFNKNSGKCLQQMMLGCIDGEIQGVSVLLQCSENMN